MSKPNDNKTDIRKHFSFPKTPIHKNNRRATSSGDTSISNNHESSEASSSSTKRLHLPRSTHLADNNNNNNNNNNVIREVSNDAFAFFSDPTDEEEDLNAEDLQAFTAQYTQTVFDDEDFFVDRTTNLSQEDLCEFESPSADAGEMGLAQSDNGDGDGDGDIDDKMVDIQNNSVYKAKKQKLTRLEDTENKFFLGNRQFNKHEVFEHPTKKHFEYKIEKLFKRYTSEKGWEKMATCTVFRKREDTLLGGFLKELEFVKYNHHIDVPLKKLGVWMEKAAPVTNLYYEDNKLQHQSHGFNVVFLIAKHNKTLLTEEQKERIKKNKQEARQKLKFSQSQKGGHTIHPLIKMNGEPYRPKCFEAFAGCGGMTIGFTKAGFDVRWAVENNQPAASSHELYHRDCRVYGEDILTFMGNFKRGLLEGDPEYTSIKPDHVHGSTPCQGFSRANIYGGKNDERNNECTKHFIELVRLLKPKKSVSFENVTGILAPDNRHYLQMLVSELIKLGFNARVQVLNSARCGGDAQERDRVFVTAWRCELSGICIPKPLDTHSQGGGDLPNVRTAADAIGDLVHVEPCTGEGQVRYKGKDGNVIVTYNHTMGKNDINNVEEELIATAPARTIRRQRPVKHYSKPRCLTVRERARLQSFPDDFKFRGNLTNQRDQIGNAVPIGLATEVAKVIWDSCYSL